MRFIEDLMALKERNSLEIREHLDKIAKQGLEGVHR
jgi:hypothetical protein